MRRTIQLRTGLATAVLVVSALALALLPATAFAAFPGANGKIAFVKDAHLRHESGMGAGMTTHA